MSERTSYEPGTPCWVDLSTTDVDAGVAFYTSVFGWEHESAGPEAGGYGFFKKDGKMLTGFGPMQSEGHPPVWATYLATTDVDGSVAMATENGANVVVPAMDVMTAGRMAFVQDPAKAVVGLWEAGNHTGSQLVNEPGTWCWSEIISRDIDATKAFYTAIAGYSYDTMDMGGQDYTLFKVGENAVGGIVPMPDDAPPVMPSYWSVSFAVEDCGATVDSVTSNGGTVVMPAQDISIGTFAVLADPQGAAFGVMQFAEQPE